MDASSAASWAFSDELGHIPPAMLEGRYRLLVPALWWFELRNILVINERRRRIDFETTQMFLAGIATLVIEVDLTPDSDLVLHLARAHHLPVYDAAYLELALRSQAQLATLDRKLAQAADSVGVRVSRS